MPGKCMLMTAATTGLLLLSACSPTNSTTQSASEGDRTAAPVGYSALFLQDPAQAAMVETFTQAAQEHGLEALPPTGANGNASQQDTDIRNLVTSGARSLLVVPADARAVVPPVEFARQRGLPVATLFLGPKGGATDVALVADNFN